FITSSALATEKCDYKVKFDDAIPANISLIKLGRAKSYTKFEVKPDYFETTIQDCAFKNNKYYILSSSITQPENTLSQSILVISVFDKFGVLSKHKFINKKWTCEIDDGFYKKNNKLEVLYSCADKSENSKYNKYAIEVK
ncbi:hypothetical protein, partial [Acinetobacter stercoris]|uniref:hypothetical protein n=1 Tax=Acinetobacter stercoris TaxID=2126983 RepID=UPI000EFB9ACC